MFHKITFLLGKQVYGLLVKENLEKIQIQETHSYLQREIMKRDYLPEECNKKLEFLFPRKEVKF